MVVMAGLVPAMHVPCGGSQGRRGCPGQARAWRCANRRKL